MRLSSTFIAAAAAAGMGMPALAQTEISLWHAMAGANNEVIDKIASDFNTSQSEYKVTPVFKGSYPETLNAGIAAFRAGQAPDIIQVFDVGTGVMMAAGRHQAGRRGDDRGRARLRPEPVPAGHRGLLFQA